MAYNSNDQRTVPQALQGVTSQNTGTASGAIQNSYSAQAQGNNLPMDAAGRAGYLAVAEPGGPNSAILVPGGQYSGSDNNVQIVGSPAGSAGGGGQYPQVAGGTAAPIPWNAPGWTNQGNTGDDQSELTLTAPGSLSPQVHTVAMSVQLSASGGSGSGYTYTAPVGLPNTIACSAGGLLTSSSTLAVAGTFTFMIEVTDSLGNHADRWFTVVFS